MGNSKRKTHDKKFKAKVALEALREESTIQQIAQKYQIHPNQVGQWKKHLLDGAEELFERPNKKIENTEQEAEEKLFQHIGSLTVENQFLKKKYRELYGHEPNLLMRTI